jgi:hypothetical protein
MLRGALPQVAGELLDDFERVGAWERRMGEIGEGRRTEIDAATAHAAARDGSVPWTIDVDRRDAQGLAAGTIVEVCPDDTQRGGSVGELVILRANEVAIRRSDERVGTVLVHFPRLGYRVTPVG